MSGAHRPLQINGVTVPYGAAVENLARSLEGPAPHAATFKALELHPDPRATNVIVRACAVSDPFLRRAAVEALGARHDGARHAALLGSLLVDPSVHVVRSACEAAAALGLASAAPRLVELLGDASPSTRRTAASALGKLRTTEAFDALVDAFRRERDEDTRRSMGFALRDLDPEERLGELWELWRADPLARHRAWACEIAQRLDETHRRGALHELARDVDGHVRGAAERALAALEWERPTSAHGPPEL